MIAITYSQSYGIAEYGNIHINDVPFEREREREREKERDRQITREREREERERE